MKFTYHSITHYLMSILTAIVSSSKSYITIGGTIYAFQNYYKTEHEYKYILPRSWWPHWNDLMANFTCQQDKKKLLNLFSPVLKWVLDDESSKMQDTLNKNIYKKFNNILDQTKNKMAKLRKSFVS